LEAGQRLAFLTTLFGWFDSWRTFAYVVLPLAVVSVGAVPIVAPGAVFIPFFITTLALQFIALRLLARGHYPPLLSVLFEFLRMPAVLPATLAILAPRRSFRFRVTPKGRRTGDRQRIAPPRLLSILAAASALGLAWFTASLLGLSPVHYGVPWAAIGAAMFIAVNLAFLLAAIGRIRSNRFAGNRRASTRLAVVAPARLDGRAVEIVDLSITGARVIGPRLDPPIGERPVIAFTVGKTPIELEVIVRRQVDGAGSTELGLEFEPGQEAELARLVVAVFGAAEPEPRDVGRLPEAVWHSVA
jgi:cellulose synthase (UDP-forming)